MASINRLKRELLFKIVFYGPGLGGKTTTLRHVHDATKPENRGNMVSLATDTDRTLYFDYLPVQLLKLGDMTVKLLLYTVPGQVYYGATRKLVLSGADGIVFVADSQGERLDSNHESLDDLNACLAEQGRKLSGIPHAFQWNKRDLPNLVATGELDRRLNLFDAPAVATVATTGQGVFEVLEQITRLVVDNYRADLPTASASLDDAPLVLDSEDIGLADAIRGLADSQPARSSSSIRRNAAAPPTVAAMTQDAASSAVANAVTSPVSRGAVGQQASPVGTLQQANAAAAAPQANTAASSPHPGTVERPIQVATIGTSPQAGSSATSPQPTTTGSSPQGNATTSAQANAVAPSVTTSRGLSFAELWPAADRDAVRRVEHALAAGDAASAIAGCEDLLSRVLATGSLLLGSQSQARDPALLVGLLGLEGTRYLSFRAVARAARVKRLPTVRAALESFTFVLEARRALDRAAKAPG